MSPAAVIVVDAEYRTVQAPKNNTKPPFAKNIYNLKNPKQIYNHTLLAIIYHSHIRFVPNKRMSTTSNHTPTK